MRCLLRQLRRLCVRHGLMELPEAEIKEKMDRKMVWKMLWQYEPSLQWASWKYIKHKHLKRYVFILVNTFWWFPGFFHMFGCLRLSCSSFSFNFFKWVKTVKTSFFSSRSDGWSEAHPPSPLASPPPSPGTSEGYGGSPLPSPVSVKGWGNPTGGRSFQNRNQRGRA